MLPTYLLSSDLRGTTVTTNPAAPTNVYATVPVSALPLLQPLALPVTVANIGLNAIAGVKLNNPAVTALQPVTESLVNLGYTDVRWDAASSTYTRTLDKGNVVTPFGSLPTDVSVRDLPGNLIKSLQVGFGAQFVGDRTNGTTNAAGTSIPRTTPAYWTLDAMLNYKVSEKLSFRLNLYNLNNAFYFDRLGGGHLIPGAGRSASIAMGFRF